MREKLIELLCEAKSKSADEAWFSNATYAQQLEIEADHLIANGVTIQRWIPANEPPKDNTENQWVIYKVGGSYFYSTGYYDGKNWRSAITDFKIQIAGWMPLPEPPKGE